jgi:hypothetical protein
MSDEPVNIDRDKLRAAIRRLGPEYVFYMLDDAIDLLPLTELEGIAKKYLDLKRLRPDGDRQTKATLLADVKAFDKASRAGEYYESFMVNSRNCTAQSTGTTAWIATCNRLLDRCVAEERRERADGDPSCLRHPVWAAGLHRPGQRRCDLLRRRGWFLAGGCRLEQGPAFLVQGPLGHGVLRGVRRANQVVGRAPLQLRPREVVCCCRQDCATAEQREALAKVANRQSRGHSQARKP